MTGWRGVLIFLGGLGGLVAVITTAVCLADSVFMWFGGVEEALKHRHEMKMMRLRAKWRREIDAEREASE